jgi:hypothetical protein
MEINSFTFWSLLMLEKKVSVNHWIGSSIFPRAKCNTAMPPLENEP